MKFKEREAEVIKKYSNAKEIYLLLRERKLNKKEILFDWLVLFFTPLTSIVAEADMLSDLGTYYLVVEGNKYLLVRAEKKEISKNLGENIITFQDMQLDVNRCQVTIQNEVMDLTKIELALLEMFMQQPGRVFTKEQLYERGWDGMYVVDDNTIRVTISRLRDKIGEQRIKTIRGLGYRLESGGK